MLETLDRTVEELHQVLNLHFCSPPHPPRGLKRTFKRRVRQRSQALLGLPRYTIGIVYWGRACRKKQLMRSGLVVQRKLTARK